MKTLINKANPQIRITAPEIELWFESAYVVGQHLSETEDVRDITLVIPKKDWTLVEEEPVDLEEDWCPVKEEPVELEKEIKEWITPPNPSIDPKKEIISGELHINCIIATARHFYELGRKGGSK